MGNEEQVLLDRPGRFLLAFNDREKQENADWIG